MFSQLTRCRVPRRLVASSTPTAPTTERGNTMPNPTYAEMMNELYGESAENTLQFAIEFQRNALRALERNDVGEAIMELHGLLGTLVELAYRCDLNVDFNA